MSAGHPITLLMFFTLFVVLGLLIFLLARHLRKGSNRHPMEGERERNIEEIRREGPNP